MKQIFITTATFVENSYEQIVNCVYEPKIRTVMKIILSLVTGICLLLLPTGCLKEPGEGGTSTLIGRVYAYDYDALMQNLRAQYYAPDEDVYIIYGDDSIYSDRTRTSYDGYYRFEYLRPGNYNIYVYSKNLQTKLPPDIPVIKTVQITAEHQVIVVDDIEIIK